MDCLCIEVAGKPWDVFLASDVTRAEQCLRVCRRAGLTARIIPARLQFEPPAPDPAPRTPG